MEQLLQRVVEEAKKKGANLALLKEPQRKTTSIARESRSNNRVADMFRLCGPLSPFARVMMTKSSETGVMVLRILSTCPTISEPCSLQGFNSATVPRAHVNIARAAIQPAARCARSLHLTENS